MEIARRKFLTGLGSLFLAAPAIVRASSLDAIRGVPMDGFRLWTDPNEWVSRYIIHGIDEWGKAKVEIVETHDTHGTRWREITSITNEG